MCLSKGPVYFYILGEFTSNPIKGREDLVTHVKFKESEIQKLRKSWMSAETKSKMPLVTIILVNNWKGFILFHWIGTLTLQNANSWLGSMFLSSKGEDKIVIKNNSMQKKLLETRMSVSNLKLNSGWHLRSKFMFQFNSL